MFLPFKLPLGNKLPHLPKSRLGKTMSILAIYVMTLIVEVWLDLAQNKVVNVQNPPTNVKYENIPVPIYKGFRHYYRLVDRSKAYARGVEFLLQKKLAKDFYRLVSACYFRNRYQDCNSDWRDRLYDNQYLFNVIDQTRIHDARYLHYHSLNLRRNNINKNNFVGVHFCRRKVVQQKVNLCPFTVYLQARNKSFNLVFKYCPA